MTRSAQTLIDSNNQRQTWTGSSDWLSGPIWCHVTHQSSVWTNQSSWISSQLIWSLNHEHHGRCHFIVGGEVTIFGRELFLLDEANAQPPPAGRDGECTWPSTNQSRACELLQWTPFGQKTLKWRHFLSQTTQTARSEASRWRHVLACGLQRNFN